jgi:hypothetical protein
VVGDGAVGPPPVLWQHDGAEPIIALSRHASYAQLRSRAASTSKTVIDLQASLPTPSWNVVCLTSPSDHRTNIEGLLAALRTRCKVGVK